MKKPIAGNLRRLLTCRRVTGRSSLDDLSAEIGISRDALYRFECGRTVNDTVIAMILLWLLK